MIRYPVKHQKPHDKLRDARWTITKEWCGCPERRYVVRFCDDYIANAKLLREAKILCFHHVLKHRKN